MDRRYIKILCGLLAVCLCFSTLGSPVSALQYSGSGSYMSGKYYTALTDVRLTGDPRVDIVNVARSQLGYQEGGSPNQLSGEVYGSVNHTEYGAWYGVQDMWCAMFVSWCAARANISTSLVPSHCYTPEGLNWFATRSAAYSREQVQKGKYTPMPGDLIYFKSSRNAKTTNHVGIVTGYANGRVYTIEGNVGTAGILTNGGMVVERSYPITNKYIVYICAPNYADGSTRVREDADAFVRQAQLQSLSDALCTLEGGNAYDRVNITANGICLGIGQWYGSRGLELLRQIRSRDEAAFASLDTQGVAQALQKGSLPPANEGFYRNVAQILASDAGIRVQKEWIDTALEEALEYAAELGITDPEALLLYAAVTQLASSPLAKTMAQRAGSNPTAEDLLNVLEQLAPGLVRSCKMLIA